MQVLLWVSGILFALFLISLLFSLWRYPGIKARKKLLISLGVLGSSAVLILLLCWLVQL